MVELVNKLQILIANDFESKYYNKSKKDVNNAYRKIRPYTYSDGYVAVNSDKGWALYDESGNIVIGYGTFEEVRPVHNGLAWVKKDGKWGVIELEDIEQETESTTTDETINWQQLYADELTKILYSDEYMINPEFDLYDINDDDIPELFVYLGGGFGSTSTIYTVYNNSLVEFRGSRYNEYSPSKQILYSYDLTAGSLIFSYSELKENNLNSKLDGRSNSELNDYSINGEDVTEEIYNKYVNEFDSDDYVNIDYKYPLNEETINSVLFESNNFNIKNYEGTYYPVNSDFNIMVDISVQTESLTTVEIHFTNDTGTRVSDNIFTGDINSNIFTFETDDGFGKNSFTLEFQDDKIILTGKCVDCYSQLWGIPEMNQIEMQSS